MLDSAIRYHSITLSFNFLISSSVNGSALTKEQSRNTRQRYGTSRQLPTDPRLLCRRTGTAAGVRSAGAAVSARFATGCCCRRRSRRECRSPAPSAIDGTAVLTTPLSRWLLGGLSALYSFGRQNRFVRKCLNGPFSLIVSLLRSPAPCRHTYFQWRRQSALRQWFGNNIGA